MEWITLLRDWVVAAVVLYIAIRYAYLSRQEKSALQARIAHLEGLSSPSVASDLQTVSQAMEQYSKRVREMKSKYEQIRKEKEQIIGKVEKVWFDGVSRGCFEGEAALLLVYRNLVSRAFELNRRADAIEIHETVFDRLDKVKTSRYAVEKGEMPAFVNIRDLAEDLKH